MMTNDEKIVRTPTRIDLHLHSAASTRTRDRGNADLAKCGIDRLDVFVSRLENHSINMCAITDHDLFDQSMYLALKKKEGTASLKKVLPGIEFSVSFEEQGREKRTVIHIVAIFDDSKPELLDSIASLVCDDDGNPQYDDTDNHAFTERKFTEILRNIGLNAVLVGHEKSAGQARSKDVSSLGMEKANEVILAEYVDALEIKNRRKELDVKKLIGFYDKEGVPFLIGSDCHDWDVYPRESKASLERDEDISFSVLKCLPTFEGLLMSVTDSSRIRVGNSAFFNNGAPMLDKIEIRIGEQRSAIPLSPGINAIIGDNSIGKSMLIHSLSGYRHLTGNVELRKGYESYCDREGIEIEPSLEQSLEFRFDDQSSVKTTLEELHTGAGDSDYFAQYYQRHVDVDGAKAATKRFISKCINALKSKAKFNDAVKELEACEVDLRSSPVSEKLAIIRIPQAVSFEAIDAFISALRQEEQSIEEIRSKYRNMLSELGESADQKLRSAIEEISQVRELAEIHRIEYEREDLIKKALRSAANAEKEELKAQKTDEQRSADMYVESLALHAKKIADVVLLGNGRFNKKIDFHALSAPRATTEMGKFLFVSELNVGETDEKYCKSLLEEVFNKPVCNRIVEGIEGDTPLTTQEVSQAVSGTKPAVSTCFKDIEKQLHGLIDQLHERRKITNEDIGVDGEPSAGLYGRLFFELLAEDSSNYGVYIIDQPEDQISQTAIKEHVLDAFKRMSGNRQVIMITHNPQFVVNLDVDNVVAFSRDEDSGSLVVRSGALEYEGENYRMLDIVANTVEGGADVVRKRLKRYGSERN